MLHKGISMASKLITTHELTGTRVLGGKKGTKRIGKIRRFVFHPKEKRVIGFVVKRPDLLWMFHRADVFVPIDGYDLVDGRVIIRPDAAASGKAYCKKEGLNWDDCVLWVGLPVMSEDGESYGIVGNVTFNRLTGTVDCFETDNGATSNALLGKRTIRRHGARLQARHGRPRWPTWAPRAWRAKRCSLAPCSSPPRWRT